MLEVLRIVSVPIFYRNIVFTYKHKVLFIGAAVGLFFHKVILLESVRRVISLIPQNNKIKLTKTTNKTECNAFIIIKINLILVPWKFTLGN